MYFSAVSLSLILCLAGLFAQEEPQPGEGSVTNSTLEMETSSPMPVISTNLNNTEIDTPTVNVQPKVINGLDLPEGKMRYIVSLRGDDPDTAASVFCGGTIVHPQWVMTAAHCFIATTSAGDSFINPKLWHLQMGSSKIDTAWGDKRSLFDKLLGVFGGDTSSSASKPEHVHVEKVVQHPLYVSSDLEHDIAMVKLSRPLRMNHLVGKVEIALLPPKARKAQNWPKVGQECVLAGWGCTKAGGHAVSKAQYAFLQVLANDKCSALYTNQAGLNDEHEFCAGYHKEGVGICPGDSGSGLLCKQHNQWVVEGVASATHRKQPGEFPGIFTRVSYFRDWLEEVVEEN